MSRKLRAPKFKVLDNEDTTTNPVSLETGVKQLDVVYYELEIDTTVNGTLVVEGSCDAESAQQKTWHALDFATPILLNGAVSQKDQILIRDNSFTFLRLKFQNNTGTGAISATVTGVSTGA